MKTLRILYLEDTDYDVDLVRNYLEEDEIVFDLIHVKTREDFIAALNEEELDIRKLLEELVKVLDGHRPLHRTKMKITVIGKSSRICEHMFKTLPWFIYH